MSHYSLIAIIYNPNSTGSSGKLAKDFAAQVKSRLPKQPVKVIATEHAGHGETLAYDLALKYDRPLIISASGDGGYHELVNGLMKAKEKGAHPIAGLLPAGNANDHYHNLHSEDLIDAVEQKNERTIDLLKLSAISNGVPLTRYGHSYMGIGLSPKVGKVLNKTKLNAINEVVIVLKVLFNLKPVRVIVKGKVQRYDSLVFSNVNKMSKVFLLSKEADVDDGKFEVTAFKRTRKFALIASLFKASVGGLKGDKHVTEYAFKTIKPTLIQIDGEIEKLDAGTTATVSIEHKTFECIV